MNTLVMWLYRDAANYKAQRTAVLEGPINARQRKAILASLDNKEFFIPSQVGLDDLQHELQGFPDQDDHVWHELVEMGDTKEDPTGDLTTHQFVLNMVKAKDNWKVAETSERLGIK